MKKSSKIVALLLATTFLFSACSGGNSGKKDNTKKESGVQDNLVIENEGKAVDNATLKIAYISDSPFTGIFHGRYGAVTDGGGSRADREAGKAQAAGRTGRFSCCNLVSS